MRNLTIAAFVFGHLLIMTAFPATAGVREGASVQVVETEGTALISGQDLAQGRSEAVRNALERAVEQVAGRWVSPPEAERKKKSLKERIYHRAEGYVHDFRIVSETSASGFYTVTVRTTVFAESIRNDLQELGLIGPGTLRPPLTRVLLTVQGVRNYGDYNRCREILEGKITGIQGVITREVSWGMVRFDIAADDSTESVAARLRQNMDFEILFQNSGILEINLK